MGFVEQRHFSVYLVDLYVGMFFYIYFLFGGGYYATLKIYIFSYYYLGRYLLQHSNLVFIFSNFSITLFLGQPFSVYNMSKIVADIKNIVEEMDVTDIASIFVSRTKYVKCPLCNFDNSICFRKISTHIKKKHSMYYRKLFCFFCNKGMKNLNKNEYKKHKVACLLKNQTSTPIIDAKTIKARKQRRKLRRSENSQRLNEEFNYLDYEIRLRHNIVAHLDQTISNIISNNFDYVTKIKLMQEAVSHANNLETPKIKKYHRIVEPDSDSD